MITVLVKWLECIYEQTDWDLIYIGTGIIDVMIVLTIMEIMTHK